jgi:hypothetical protein
MHKAAAEIFFSAAAFTTLFHFLYDHILPEAIFY